MREGLPEKTATKGTNSKKLRGGEILFKKYVGGMPTKCLEK